MVSIPQPEVLHPRFWPAAKTLVAELPEAYSRNVVVPLVIGAQDEPAAPLQVTANATVAEAPTATVTCFVLPPWTVQLDAKPLSAT